MFVVLRFDALRMLLRRLSGAVLPNSGSLPLTERTADGVYDTYVREIARRLDAGTGDWRELPSLLSLLALGDAETRSASAEAISEVSASIPIDALPRVEEQLRDATLQAYEWNKLTVDWVTKQEWPLQIWALFTMHPSGYIREAAVRRLVSESELQLALPYLLLRVNDWVSQVRDAATVAIKDVLRTSDAQPWVPVLGLLEKLRDRTRADHAWLDREVAMLFRRPESHAALLSAAQSSDTTVARWAFRTATEWPEADRANFFRIGLEHHDLSVRMRAASGVRTWKECPGREELLAIMAADRFMPIRREALYGALDGAAAPRRASLIAALLDRHTSMRVVAHFYLREDAAKINEPFDARAFYLDAISKADSSTRAAAIGGLGECGIAADADGLVKFVNGHRPSVAAAAIRAIASLDRDRRAEWFVELLKDKRPSVAREACRALVGHGAADQAERIREVLRGEGPTHSRRYALRVLLRRHPYDAVVDAIHAIASGNDQLAGAGSDFIERSRSWHVRYGPSDAQKGAAEAALAELTQPLTASLRRRLEAFMGIVVK